MSRFLSVDVSYEDEESTTMLQLSLFVASPVFTGFVDPIVLLSGPAEVQ
jgi:hypothetical protein